MKIEEKSKEREQIYRIYIKQQINKFKKGEI